MWERIKYFYICFSPIKAEMIASMLLLLMAAVLLFAGCTQRTPDQPIEPVVVVVSCYAESGHQTVLDTITIEKTPLWQEVIDQSDTGIIIRNHIDIVAAYTGHCTAKRIELPWVIR